MSLKTIVEKGNKLVDELSKHSLRRSLWNAKTKDLIFNTLSKIQSEVMLEWFVHKNDVVSNHEAVYIKFKNRHSGIVVEEKVRNKSGVKAYIIEGGYLLYTQHVNGRISVLISYPYAEGLIEPSEHKKLGYHDPEEITEELIYQHVERFLDEMLAWENADLKQPLNFPVSNELSYRA